MTSTIQAPESASPLQASKSLQATRMGMRLLSGVAPCLAARAAEHLFCKPRRFPRPAKEQARLEDAEPLTIRNGLQSLPAWRWGQGPTVLLVHGWEGRGSQLFSFVAPLVRRGYSVLAWDAPGHGDSPGSSSSMVEFTDAVWSASRHVPELHGVIAHSMGCAASAWALSEGLPARRAAFLASPSRLRDYCDDFSSIIGLGPGVQRRMVRSMERRFHVELDQIDIARFPEPRELPVLLIHDREDREVSWTHAERIAQAWPGTQLHWTEGYGHRRILRKRDVVERVVDWIDTRPALKA